ncbi:MAG: DUF3284 domain-containing protein [Enterococcus sp.]
MLRVDTLSYQRTLECKAADFFAALMKEQLRYFQSKDRTIKKIVPGIQVHSYLQTKMNKQVADSTIEVGEIIPNEKLELITHHTHGKIYQTYELIQTSKGQQRIKYSETNELMQMRNQLSLLFTLPIYKLIYNKNTKRRMQYLERIAQNN